MNTTYHLSSADELNADIIDSIKAAYKSKAITIIVEEDLSEYQLSEEMKMVLDERMKEDLNTYLTEEESIKKLSDKYGL
jgi:hypothetical protein